DHALAESLRRLDPDSPDAILAAAALASLAVAAGHAGFDPAQPQQLVDAPIDWPAPEAWRQALASSRWVARPDAGDAESPADAPLVLEHGLLSLRRDRDSDRPLAARRPLRVSGPEAPLPDSIRRRTATCRPTQAPPPRRFPPSWRTSSPSSSPRLQPATTSRPRPPPPRSTTPCCWSPAAPAPARPPP